MRPRRASRFHRVDTAANRQPATLPAVPTDERLAFALDHFAGSGHAVKAFQVDFGMKYPKVVAKITYDLDALLEFYHYPAEQWIHLRTTNPIESTFATVRLRIKPSIRL